MYHDVPQTCLARDTWSPLKIRADCVSKEGDNEQFTRATSTRAGARSARVTVGCSAPRALTMSAPKPINFLMVSKTDRRRLQITKSAYDALETCTPVHVISVLGPARRGKSTVLSGVAQRAAILSGARGAMLPEPFVSSDNFDEAQTEGSQMMMVPIAGGGTVVLVDVEGTDMGNTQHHAMLYAAVAALSSQVTIMCEGVLDNRVLDTLGLLVTCGLVLDNGKKAVEAPHLCVVINKMTNLIDNASGVFERVLDDKGDAYDEIRHQIRKHFPSRSAHAIPMDVCVNHRASEALATPECTADMCPFGRATLVFADACLGRAEFFSRKENFAKRAYATVHLVNASPDFVFVPSVALMMQRQRCEHEAEMVVSAVSDTIGERVRESRRNSTQVYLQDIKANALRDFDERTSELTVSARENVRDTLERTLDRIIALMENVNTLLRCTDPSASEGLAELLASFMKDEASESDAVSDSSDEDDESGYEPKYNGQNLFAQLFGMFLMVIIPLIAPSIPTPVVSILKTAAVHILDAVIVYFVE